MSEYTYQEYPKWVTDSDGKSVIVENAYDESLFLGVVGTPDEIGFEDTVTEFVYVEALDGVVVDTPPVEEVPIVAPDGEDAPIDDTPVDAAIAPDGSHIASIDTLREQADKLGLIYDKRWGALRLQQAINGASNCAA